MRCVDVNVLVFAHRPESPNHTDYLRWLDDVRRGSEPLGLIDAVLSGFVRVVTHSRIFREPTTLELAARVRRCGSIVAGSHPDSARRPALGHLRQPLPPRRRHGERRARCVPRGTGDRAGSDLGVRRPGLCPLSGTALGTPARRTVVRRSAPNSRCGTVRYPRKTSGDWLSWLERCLHTAEVMGSSPVSPTRDRRSEHIWPAGRHFRLRSGARKVRGSERGCASSTRQVARQMRSKGADTT